jgi:plastocyanin
MHNAVLACWILTIVVSACGGGGGGDPMPPPPTPVFTTLSVSPANPAMVEGDTLQLSATPRDQNGAAMSGLPAATFALTAGTSVSVSGEGRLIALDPGGSTVTATLASGGTTRTATATPNVTALTAAASVAVSGAGTSFNPATVKVATGGNVTWSFTSGGNSPHNVTFGGNSPPGGDIGDTNSGDVVRTFTTAGSYPYQCTRHGGMNGTVVVRAP